MSSFRYRNKYRDGVKDVTLDIKPLLTVFENLDIENRARVWSLAPSVFRHVVVEWYIRALPGIDFPPTTRWRSISKGAARGTDIIIVDI